MLNISQVLTTVEDSSGDIFSHIPQEVTTFQVNASIHTVGSSVMNISYNPQNLTLIPFQIGVCFFSLFGNILLILVLSDLPNSKLRITTKILMRYVSLSHCLMSTILIGRLFSMPCLIVMLGGLTSGFNVHCGLAYLGYEALILVTKPYSHQNFVSMNICKIEILTSCLVSLCFNVVAYLTTKESDDPSCHFTNGLLNPLFLCLFTGVLNIIIIITSTIQIFTLKAMKKVFPETGTLNINVIQVAPVNNTFRGVTTKRKRKFPLLRLTKMLMMSLLWSIICWFPSTISIFTFSIFEILQIEGGMEQQLLVGFSNLVALNGSLHVIVYLTMSSQIRQAMKEYLSRWIGQHTLSSCTLCVRW